MKKILLLSVILSQFSLTAATYQVGSNKTYVSPNALYNANVVQTGDIIEIDAETYTGNACLAKWTPDNLIIRGIGGMPHLEANGQNIAGKGIWILSGDNITVENIEFSGATVPDNNGAGIRLGGDGLNVMNCYFHDNENGILTNNSGLGTVKIEYSEFSNNGYGQGQTHNLYIGEINKLIFQYNYSHHAKIGHNLKSRAHENYILYNRISDEQTGVSSRLIDLSNGGFTIIMGNILMQGPNAENNNLVGYGKEGLGSGTNELYFVNNTLVNKRAASCIFVDVKPGTAVVNVFNNIFAGTGTVLQGTATAMSNNLIETTIANVKFVDEANYDYNLVSGSPAIDYGIIVGPVNGISLTPDFEYVHPTDKQARTTVNLIDAGAYEYNVVSSVLESKNNVLNVYPNPFTSILRIENYIVKKSEVIVFNVLGQDMSALIRLEQEGENTIINTSSLPRGTYFLKTNKSVNVIYKQ